MDDTEASVLIGSPSVLVDGGDLFAQGGEPMGLSVSCPVGSTGPQRGRLALLPWSNSAPR